MCATQCIYQVNRAFCVKLKPFSRSVQLVVGSLNMRERPAPAPQLSKSNSKLLSRPSSSPSKSSEFIWNTELESYVFACMLISNTV